MLLYDDSGPVSYRTSRIKIQGVDSSGEPKGEAKAIMRSDERGMSSERACSHYYLTRNGCDLHWSRLKPV